MSSKPFVIRKDVPMPDLSYVGNTKGQTKYGWMKELEIGDSIVVEDMRQVDALSNAIRKHTNFVFLRRKLGDGKFGLWVCHPRPSRDKEKHTNG